MAERTSSTIPGGGDVVPATNWIVRSDMSDSYAWSAAAACSGSARAKVRWCGPAQRINRKAKGCWLHLRRSLVLGSDQTNDGSLLTAAGDGAAQAARHCRESRRAGAGGEGEATTFACTPGVMSAGGPRPGLSESRSAVSLSEMARGTDRVPGHGRSSSWVSASR